MTEWCFSCGLILTANLLQGRLVNIQNYSLNTIASVMKKFLRKIPGGIFGPENEATIFNIIKMADSAEQLKAVHRQGTIFSK